MRQTLSELRRRHVFRVAAWYAAAAWLLIQVASTVFPQFDLPAWAVKAVIVAALIGFPAAMALAWTFDLSASGVQRTTSVAVPPAPTVAAWRAPSLWIALATGALLAFGAQQAWQRIVRPAGNERPGIAVLPFDTLGDAANTALAGGMHEAVLNELSALRGLRVIARTSVLRYPATTPDVTEIGRALDVPYVLEGSVQRDGGRLRVHAQLIDAATNEHVWSETYDREAGDIFGVQTRLARDIARRLQVTLLPGDDARSALPPTEDAAAYEIYLAALDQLSRSRVSVDAVDSARTRSSLLEARTLLDDALRRDPDFALAHAALAHANIALWFWFRDDPIAQGTREASLAQAMEALRLQPSLPEGHRELGRYYYWGHFDYSNAATALETARRGLPNDAETTGLLGLIRRRQGRMGEADALFRDAAALQPNDLEVRLKVPRHELNTFNFDAARIAAHKVLEDFPAERRAEGLLAELEFCRTSESAPLAAQLKRGYGSESQDSLMRVVIATMDGHLREIEPWAREQVTLASPDEYLSQLRLADLLRRTGRQGEAAALVQGRIASMEADRSPSWSAGGAQQDLMALYMVAGRPADAVRIAHALVEANPVSRDPLGGGEMLYWAAVAHAEAGQAPEALEFLRQYAAQPFGLCAAWLRRDPSLAPLRERPEFERIIAPHDWRG